MNCLFCDFKDEEEVVVPWSLAFVLSFKTIVNEIEIRNRVTVKEVMKLLSFCLLEANGQTLASSPRLHEFEYS